MNRFYKIEVRRAVRTTVFKRVANTDYSIDNAIDIASNMSDNQKIKFIRDFIAKSGFENTINLVKSFLKNILSFKEFRNANVGDQGFMDQPGNSERQNLTKREPSLQKRSLDKIANMLGLLTFILVWASAGTSDFHSLVLKSPDFVAEIQTLGAAFGTGILAFLLKYFAHKIK